MPREPRVGQAYITVNAETSRLAGQIRRQLNDALRNAGDEGGKRFADNLESRIDTRLRRLSGTLSTRMRDAGEVSGRRFAAGINRELSRLLPQFGRRAGARFGQEFTANAVPGIEDAFDGELRQIVRRMGNAGDEGGGAFSRGVRPGLSDARINLGLVTVSLGTLRQAVTRLAPLTVAAGDAVVALGLEAAALAAGLSSAASAGLTAIPVVTSLIQGALVGVAAFNGFGSAVADGEAALAALTPEARAAAVAVRELRVPFGELQDLIAENVFAGLDDDISNLANNLLPTLRTQLSGTGTVLNNFFEDFAQFAGSEQFVSDLNFVLGNQNDILDSMLDTVVPLTSAFFDFLVPALPFAENLADAIEAGAERLADLLAEARQSGDLEDFLESAYENASNLLAGIRDLTVGVVNFFSAGADRGADMLETFAALSAEFRAFASSAEGQEQFVEFFEFGRRVVQRLFDVLESAGDVLGPSIRIINELLEALEPLLPVFEGLAEVAGVGLGAIADALEAVNGPMLTFVATAFTLRRLNLARLFGGIVGPVGLAGSTLRGFGRSAGIASTAALGLRAGLAGATAFLGGPLGIAIAGTIASISFLSSAFSANEQEVNDWFAALQQDIGELPIESQLERLRDTQGDLILESTELGGLFDRDDAKEIELQMALVGDEIERLQERQHRQRQETIESTAATTGFTERQIQARLAAGETADQIELQAEQMGELADTFGDLVDPVSEWTSLMEEAGESSRAVELGLEGANVSLDDWLDALERAQEAQVNFRDNLLEIAERGFPAVAEGLLALAETDPEAAAQLGEKLANAESRGLLERAEEVMPAAQQEINNLLAGEAANLIPQIASIAAEYGRTFADHVSTGVLEGQFTIEEALAVIDELEANPDVKLNKENFDAAIESINEDALRPLAEGVTTIQVDGNTEGWQSSYGVVRDERQDLIDSTVTIPVGGQTTAWDAAQGRVQSQVTVLDNAIADVSIDGNTQNWTTAYDLVGAQLTNLDSEIAVPSVLMDNDEFQGTWTLTNEQLDALDRSQAIPVARLDNDPLERGVQVSKTDLAELNRILALPEADLNARALLQQVGFSEDALERLDETTADPDVDADASDLFSEVAAATRALLGIPDRDVTVNVRTNYIDPLPRGTVPSPLARGGIVGHEQLVRIGEGGAAEAVIPLERPLSMIDPSVREMAALIRGENVTGMQNGGVAGVRGGVIVEPGAIQVVTPTRDPDLVAESVIDRLAILVGDG